MPYNIGMGDSNFFSKLFTSLFASNDPEAQKKRMLKNIAKDLSKTKFHFYKASSHEVLPALGKFFYDIYKVIAPAQIMFQSTSLPALKTATVDAMLSDKQRELLATITEEAINEMAKTKPIKEVSELVSENARNFSLEFENGKRTQIDDLFNRLNLFRNFCSYDFYFTLKKFDNTIRERNFDMTPHFNTINGTYIAEDLKNFIAVAWALPFDNNWDDMFKLLKTIKGVEPVTAGVWKKVMSRLRLLKDQHVFEMMVKHITEQPDYNETPKIETTYIVDPYISQITKTAESTVQAIQDKQTHSKVDSLLSQIFGDTPVQPLKYYNESTSAQFERKSLGSYKYHEPLSFLKQFLLDYGKKDIRELSDILLVRGSWPNSMMAKPMSEAYHQLLALSDKITEFDGKLAESAEYGLKFKTLMPRADRDKEARNIIQTGLRDVNGMAAALIRSTSGNLIIYAKTLKMCIEDFAKAPHSELITNWREIDHFAEDKLKEMCVNAYKKIYLIVSLMQNFPIPKEEEEEEDKED